MEETTFLIVFLFIRLCCFHSPTINDIALSTWQDVPATTLSKRGREIVWTRNADNFCR